MKSRQKFIGFIVVILVVSVAVAWLFARNSSHEQNSQTSIRYAAPLTIAAAPVYIADAKGFWDEEGLDVKVTYFDSGRKALDALLSNNAEVMSVSETPPLRAYLSGSKINTITTVTEHKEAKMTVRKDRIKAPQDVKGKKIGTVAGTNSDYYMYRWLEAHDIKTSDVTIVQLDAAALSQAFVQGEVDVMFAWEPYNYNASSKVADVSESWPTEVYSGRHTINMNTAYLENNPEVAKKIIKGFIKAEEYIKSNPEDAKKIVIERTSMSEDALNALWDEYVYKVQLDDQFSTILKEEASWIRLNDGGNSTIDATKMVDASFLSEVDAGRVEKSVVRP